jgi:hypothetical protein
VVWCGVVWCGVVWCGVVWCGVVWCGVVWRGVVLRRRRHHFSGRVLFALPKRQALPVRHKNVYPFWYGGVLVVV